MRMTERIRKSASLFHSLLSLLCRPWDEHPAVCALSFLFVFRLPAYNNKSRQHEQNGSMDRISSPFVSQTHPLLLCKITLSCLTAKVQKCTPSWLPLYHPTSVNAPPPIWFCSACYCHAVCASPVTAACVSRTNCTLAAPFKYPPGSAGWDRLTGCLVGLIPPLGKFNVFTTVLGVWGLRVVVVRTPVASSKSHRRNNHETTTERRRTKP